MRLQPGPAQLEGAHRNATIDSNHVHPATLAEDLLLRQCALRFERRSGPGGQHRNKVETAVVIEHQPTGIRAEANERRSQGENRRVAIFRLRIRLALEVRGQVGPADEPSGLWRSRCQGGRIAVRDDHLDFPALLAELLDTLHGASGDVHRAAEHLGVSPSQLVRLLKREPRALETINRQRFQRGLRPLR